jgi:hypothetical protein
MHDDDHDQDFSCFLKPGVLQCRPLILRVIESLYLHQDQAQICNKETETCMLNLRFENEKGKDVHLR